MICSLFALEKEVDEAGEVLTGLEELLCGEILLKTINVGSYQLLVHDEVSGNFSHELLGVLELQSPVLDSSEIFVHVLASVELLRDLETELDNIDGALGDGVPAALLEVADGLDNLVLHLFSALEASLDFCEVV